MFLSDICRGRCSSFAVAPVPPVFSLALSFPPSLVSWRRAPCRHRSSVRPCDDPHDSTSDMFSEALCRKSAFFFIFRHARGAAHALHTAVKTKKATNLAVPALYSKIGCPLLYFGGVIPPLSVPATANVLLWSETPFVCLMYFRKRENTFAFISARQLLFNLYT